MAEWVKASFLQRPRSHDLASTRTLVQRWKSGSGRAGFGPVFGPNFPKRNWAQSGSLANNAFSFVHISQN